MKRTPLIRFLVLLILLIVTCSAVSFFTASFVIGEKRWEHDELHGHQWLHKELGLTHEEAQQIDLFEGDYRSEREALLVEFDKRMSELAELLRESESYSAEVTKAVHSLHEVHGALQNLSIVHYYEMLNVLPPDKQDKLKELAVEALSQPE